MGGGWMMPFKKSMGQSGLMTFYTLVGALLIAASLRSVVAQGGYQAEIRRTSHGISHITAKDFGSLGFGEGYAFAQDHLCSLADQVVKVRGERARYFGAGEKNRHLNSDITMRALGIMDQATDIYRMM